MYKLNLVHVDDNGQLREEFCNMCMSVLGGSIEPHSVVSKPMIKVFNFRDRGKRSTCGLGENGRNGNTVYS